MIVTAEQFDAEWRKAVDSVMNEQQREAFGLARRAQGLSFEAIAFQSFRRHPRQSRIVRRALEMGTCPFELLQMFARDAYEIVTGEKLPEFAGAEAN